MVRDWVEQRSRPSPSPTHFDLSNRETSWSMAAPDLPPVAGNSSNSRSSLTTRQHTRKPYERPADPSSSSSFAASETRSRGGSTLTATTKAEQRQPAGGRFGSGLTRFLSAPLGWIGLSSSSSSSGFKQQQPPASRSARQQQQPSLSNDELEQPSVNELLLPYSESSAAAPTSTVSTRYAPVGSVAGSSTSYYNDPPASSFRPGSTSSSRIPLTGNSSSRINGFVPSSARPYLLQQSQRSSPGLASSMRRSETTLGFPSSPSSALLPRATATSSASTVGAWQERYARRTDHGSASAGRGGMIERGPVLVRPHLSYACRPLLFPMGRLTFLRTRLSNLALLPLTGSLCPLAPPSPFSCGLPDDGADHAGPLG